jgi:prephenate dehydrogenase
LAKLSQRLTDLLAVFDSDPALGQFLARGRSGRLALPGKHGSAQVEFARVVVEIPDTPGALAKLFADIEAAGVNVEDVAIEHDLDRQVGYLSVQVDPGRAEGLADAMRAAAWTVRDDD